MYSKPLYSLSESYRLIGRYNKKYSSVEIADLDQRDQGWTDYDPVHGASDNVLTQECDSLYDRLLLQELAS
tara:strand:- start:3563 stop:3775 length:213 start_codon:yes stop_codon:yes gene_type:complete